MVPIKVLIVCLLLLGVSAASEPEAATSKLTNLARLAKGDLSNAQAALSQTLANTKSTLALKQAAKQKAPPPAQGNGGTTVVVQNNSIDPVETFKQILPYVIAILCFFLLIFILFFFRKELAPCISFCEEGCFRLFQLCLLPFFAIMWLARKIFYPVKQVSLRGYNGCMQCMYPATQTV